MKLLGYLVIFLSIIFSGIFYIGLNKGIPTFQLAQQLLNSAQPEFHLYFPETSNLKVGNHSVTSPSGFNTSKDWSCSEHLWRGSFNVSKEKVFQQWLQLYHNDCNRPKCDIDKVHEAGIGSGLNDAVVSLGLCLAKGAIFNPTQSWKWSQGPPRCPAPTFDCYTLPTTNCSQLNVSGTVTHPAEYTSGFRPLYTSPCALAAEAGASLLWVYGQLLKYLTRADEQMQIGVAKLRREVMDKVRQFSKNRNPHYIAAHVRGGQPDGGRRPIPIDRYLSVIDALANALSRSGVQIDFVYLSGDSITARVNINELNQYPYRPHKFVTPNFIDTGNGEVEYVIRKSPELKERLMQEYFLDLEMYAGAEAYIGVHSNVWALIHSLRVGSNRKSNCMFDSHQDPPTFYCDYCDPQFWLKGFKLSC